jgi:hypothetical protein
LTPGDWKMRLSTRFGSYHRVDGQNDVVAIVKTADDARAIAALPEVSAALDDLLGACRENNPVKGLRAEERAQAALDRMRGIT